MEQAKKYGPLFGGIIITAIVLWYLFKDSVTTVTNTTVTNSNASSYAAEDEKDAIKAEYAVKIAAATDESEKAELIAERDAELEAVAERDLLYVEYFERFNAYPKSTQSNASIQAEIDAYDKRAYNTAVEEYLQYTNANPPTSCKTADEVYAALNTYKANEKAEAEKKAAVSAAQKVKTDWRARQVELDSIADLLNARMMFPYARKNTNSGAVWGAIYNCLILSNRDLVYVTNKTTSTCVWEYNSNYKYYNGGHGAGYLETRNKLLAYAEDKIGGTLANTDIMSRAKNLYDRMNEIATRQLTTNENGEVIENGKVITY